MDIIVRFPGGKRVDARIDGHTVATDQPVEAGGTDLAAAPFDLFLASLATCAGYYVLAICQARGLRTEGLEIVQHVTSDPSTHLLARVDIDVHLPPGFPEKYRAGVLRAADHCKVKKVLASPPAIAVHVLDPQLEMRSFGPELS